MSTEPEREHEVTDYSSTPTDALRRFAAHSDDQVEWWRRELDVQNENVARARRALDSWTSARDEQLHALNERVNGSEA